MRRSLSASLVFVALVGLVACSGDDGGGVASDASVPTPSDGTTELVVADEDLALCDALAAAQDKHRVLESSAPPFEGTVDEVQNLADLAPPDLATVLQGFAEARQQIADAEAEAEASGAAPAAVDALADAYSLLTSTASRQGWAGVLEFADQRCGLDAPGLDLIEEEAGDVAAAEAAVAAVEASDPTLASEIVELRAVDDDGALDDLYVVVEVSAGQDGALRLCEILSAHLYEDLDERRVGISIESLDGTFYASRFNATADCQ